MKKIFFLADSLVDLKYFYFTLIKKFDVYWVIYNNYLYLELIKLGVKKKKIFLIKNIFIYNFFFKIFNLLGKDLDLAYVLKKIERIDIKYKPDLWITDTGNILSKIKVANKKSTLKHSTPYKKFFLSENIFNYDYIFLPGKYHYNRILEFYKKKFITLKKKLLIITSPKIIPYLKNKNSKIKFLESKKLDTGKLTVLLATTHNAFKNNRFVPNNFGDQFKFLTNISEFITKELKCNFIIKLHHYHYKYLRNLDKYNLSHNNNLYIFKPNPNYDSIESIDVINSSDIIITDTSGVGPIGIFLDKKIIFLEPDKPFDWKSSDIQKNMRPGIIALSFTQLCAALLTYKKNINLFRKERSLFSKKVFHLDKKFIFKSFQNHINYILYNK